MTGRQFLALVVTVAVLSAVVAGVGFRMSQWGPHSASLSLESEGAAASFGIGRPMPNISLTDLNGSPHSIGASRGKVIVLLVQGNRCPCSAAYVDRVNALQRDYAPKGVEVWAFNPNTNETVAETRSYVAEHHVAYPVAYDKGLKVADAIGAACTTETWVVDRQGILRYHGRIDDNIYHPEKVTKRDLRNALDDVLANRSVRIAETRAYACTVHRGDLD